MRVIALLVVTLAACGFGDNGVSQGLGSPDAAAGVDASDPPPPVDAAEVPPVDAPPAAECSIIPQDGCDPGDACDLGDPSSGPHECRDVTKNGGVDSLCASVTECGVGLGCFGDEGDFWCSRFCDSDAQCGANARCLVGLRDENDDPLPEKLCTNACNALAQTGCPSGLKCNIFGDGAQDFSDCGPSGTQLDGQACTSHSECLPGSICLGNADVCAELCNLGGANTCAAGQTCRAFAATVIVQGISYGFCD